MSKDVFVELSKKSQERGKAVVSGLAEMFGIDEEARTAVLPISKLREKIDESKKQIRKLNRNLESKPFHGDTYEFIVKANEDPAFRKYYDILCSNVMFYNGS